MKTIPQVFFPALCLMCLPSASDSKIKIPVAGLVNIWTLVTVDGVLDPIIGFVVDDPANTYLVRAVGPGLKGLDIPEFLEDPVISVKDGDKIYANDDWEDGGILKPEEVKLLEDSVGAFHLESGSADSMLVVAFSKGPHTILVKASSKNPNLRPTGRVRVEIYLIPKEVELDEP